VVDLTLESNARYLTLRERQPSLACSVPIDKLRSEPSSDSSLPSAHSTNTTEASRPFTNTSCLRRRAQHLTTISSFFDARHLRPSRPFGHCKVLKLKYPRRGFFSCDLILLRTRKSSNTTSSISRPNTGSSIAEQFAMAGNEIDLLKQATQAMMARYEGEYRFPSTLGHSTRYIQLFVRNFLARCYMLWISGRTELSKTVLVFSCLFRL
jgi:hypothetical protein